MEGAAQAPRVRAASPGRCLPRRRVGRRPFARPRVVGGEEAVAAGARGGALPAHRASRVTGRLRLGLRRGRGSGAGGRVGGRRGEGQARAAGAGGERRRGGKMRR